MTAQDDRGVPLAVGAADAGTPRSGVRPKVIYSSARCTVSEDELHRYVLTRSWRRRIERNGVVLEDPLAHYRAIVYLMLNPSTADGERDDPTIKSCVRIANYHGAGHILVGNLFTFRATDWKRLRDAITLGDPANTLDSQITLLRLLSHPQRYLRTNYVIPTVVFAWGSHVQDLPGSRERIEQVLSVYNASPLRHRPPLCLGTTKSGNPNHPLFMPEATPLQPWTMELQMKAISSAR